MKKIIVWVLVACLLLAGCRKAEPIIEETVGDWLEQFDLGVRYLQEDNYEAAILAFTAVIEIDDKNVDAYLYRAESYVKAADVLAEEDPEENKNKIHDYLDKAEDDYNRVIELAPEREDEVNQKLEDLYQQGEVYGGGLQGKNALLGIWRSTVTYEENNGYFEIIFFEDGTFSQALYFSDFSFAVVQESQFPKGTWKLLEQTGNACLIEMHVETGNELEYVVSIPESHSVVLMTINGNTAQLEHQSGDEGVLWYDCTYERQETDFWSFVEACRNKILEEEKQDITPYIGTWKISFERDDWIFFDEITFFEDGTVRKVEYNSDTYDLPVPGEFFPHSSSGTWKLIDNNLIELELECADEWYWSVLEADGSYTSRSHANFVVFAIPNEDNTMLLDYNYVAGTYDKDSYYAFLPGIYERQEISLWSLMEEYRNGAA